MKSGVNICIICILLSLVGCGKATHLSLTINSAPGINDGVLLPMDIIAVEKSKVEQVLDVGPEDWFGDSLRDSLHPGSNEDIHRLAVKADTSRVVDVRIGEEVEQVVIFADFENSVDRESQQIIIIPEGWMTNEVVIDVESAKMRKVK